LLAPRSLQSCRSGCGPVVVVQQSTGALATSHFAVTSGKFRIRANQLVPEALMVTFSVVTYREVGRCTTHRAFAEPDQPFQDSLIVRTKRSAYAFRFGFRAGSFADVTPASLSLFRNSSVNNGSRSWIK